ncbi:protein phosphatase 1 regulatory subunit 14A isoform X1 [Ahaetulla prasina]|uniref:protein phosphatase 1 regulatory subunit 14A isoform X1 n=1 Tax=Ahaetulla prasina TaxID=499056 RepID=UPI002647F1B0|nr:protein phosphatase 1 regulatory subunit 14A isoform X1 [Ahaetulla prasina]
MYLPNDRTARPRAGARRKKPLGVPLGRQNRSKKLRQLSQPESESNDPSRAALLGLPLPLPLPRLAATTRGGKPRLFPEGTHQGQEDEMPDEVNIDDLLEMDTDEERAKKLQGTLESCHNNTEDFTRELLEKLRGLRTEHVLRRTSPSSQRNMDKGPKVPQ